MTITFRSLTVRRGRISIHELVQIGPELQRLIVERADMGAMRAYASRGGHKDLHAAGMELVLARQTTPEEIARAIFVQ